MWLIANDATRTKAHPKRERTARAEPGRPPICQIDCGRGRHCQKIRPRQALDRRTNVLRSIDLGMIRVHQRLKAGRAMTVCWATKAASSAVLINRERTSGPGVPVSIDLGTPQLPTKPIA